jgi:XTP/dITP diphosphohydrolase
MTMNFILASTNAHKASELEKLGDPTVFTISAASEKIEVVEDGDTFQENALKKATEYFQKFGTPTLADDSGLVVKSLPGELGVLSARFGGEGLNDRDRAELLVKKMEDFKERALREAYFVSHLCFYLSKDEIYFFEGRMSGEIAYALRGEHGFGYDPVFIPEEFTISEEPKTLAQDPEWKSVHSHRARAMNFAMAFFKERNGQKI